MRLSDSTLPIPDAPVDAPPVEVAPPFGVIRLATPESWRRERRMWDQWADGYPFCRFSWLWDYWQSFGRDAELFVLKIVSADGTVCGYVPWERRRRAGVGRVLSFLGNRTVAGDYLTFLHGGTETPPWIGALADWLETSGNWDRIDLSGAVCPDPAVEGLVNEASRRNWPIAVRSLPSCWRLALPSTWEAYLRRLSKSHRKRLRRQLRDHLDSGRLNLWEPDDLRAFSQSLENLVHLHERRWQAAGQPGIFASSRVREFLFATAREAFQDGRRCRIFELRDAGRPVASEIHFVEPSTATLYAFQSGRDPDFQTVPCGNLLNAAVIRKAIEEGFQAIDYLRGDEPYKAHFRAEPATMFAQQLFAPTWAGRMRRAAWVAARSAKQRWNACFQRPALPSTESTT